MGKHADLTGQQFGRLTALYRVDTRPTEWHCRCICGNAEWEAAGWEQGKMLAYAAADKLGFERLV